MATKSKAASFSGWAWPLWGVVLGFSAPGEGFWLLAWLALAPAFWALRQCDGKGKALAQAMLYGVLYHAVALRWLLELHPVTWMGFSTGESLLIAIGAWSVAAGYGGLWMGGLLFLWRQLRGPGQWLFPVIWLAGWWLFRQTDLGVPLGLLEYSQSSVPVMRQWAAWVGAGGMGALLVLHGMVGAWGVGQGSVGRKALAFLGLPVLIWGLAWGFTQKPVGTANSLPPVAILQGNIPIEVIRDAGRIRHSAEADYLVPLATLPLDPGTLVILPEEGALPGIVDLSAPLAHPALRALANLGQKRQVAIVAGGLASGPRGVYNALVYLEPGRGPVFYHKRRLVPFGEYLPWGGATWMGSLLPGIALPEDFQRGPGPRVFTLGKKASRLRFGGLICFEMLYPELSAELRRAGSRFLVNASNLGWFHGSHGLERLFLAIAQLRASENHLPVIISANTGISAILSAEGEILVETPSAQKAFRRWPEAFPQHGNGTPQGASPTGIYAASY